MQQQVTYLGFEIILGQQRLRTDRKEAICHVPQPETARDLCALLRMAVDLKLWTTGQTLI